MFLCTWRNHENFWNCPKWCWKKRCSCSSWKKTVTCLTCLVVGKEQQCYLEKGSRQNSSQELTKPEVFLPLGIRVDFLWSGVSALFSNGRTAGGFFKETASYVQTAKSSDTLSARAIPIWVPNHSNWLRSNLTRQRSFWSRRCAAKKRCKRRRMPGHARPLNVDKNDRLSWLLPPTGRQSGRQSGRHHKVSSADSQPDASAPQPPLVWLAPSREHVCKTNSASKHVHNLHNTSKQNQQNTSASSLHFSSLSTLT